MSLILILIEPQLLESFVKRCIFPVSDTDYNEVTARWDPELCIFCLAFLKLDDQDKTTYSSWGVVFASLTLMMSESQVSSVFFSVSDTTNQDETTVPRVLFFLLCL